MSRRIFALVFIALFAAVLVGGCSDTDEETINSVIKDFYAAYNAEDWEVCLGHIDDINHMGESAIESVLQTARAATGKVTVDSVEDIEISGSSASAYVRITYGDQSETKLYPLLKKGGSWKIAWVWP